MELAQFADYLLNIYNDMSTELGSVLAVLLITLVLIVLVVFASMLLNARSNARMRSAQSNTQDTINELVRAQSERSAEANVEAKRLNDLLLTQTMEYNKAFNEQARRLTTIEAQIPIYKEEIEDLKSNRETLLEVVMKERQQHREAQSEAEKRHAQEIAEIRQKFEANRQVTDEFRSELASVKARLEERDKERQAHQQESERVTTLIEQVSSMNKSIESLAKVIVNEFQKFNEAVYSSGLVVADVAGGAGDVSGRGNSDSND